MPNKSSPSPMRCSPSRRSTATFRTMEGDPLTRPLSRAYKNNSDLCGEISRMSLTVFFFARQKKEKTCFGGLSRVLCIFLNSLSYGPINRRRREAIETRSRRCRRQHALSSSFTWQDIYPHVFCVLPLFPITSRGRSTRCIATPLVTRRNSTKRSGTRWSAWWSKSGARRISSKRRRPCIRLPVGQFSTFLFQCVFYCETMSGVARPSRVVLTSETHPKSVGVCPRRLQPNVLVRSEEVLAGAGRSNRWSMQRSFNEVTAEAGFESSRTTAPVLPTSEWVASWAQCQRSWSFWWPSSEYLDE